MDHDEKGKMRFVTLDNTMENGFTILPWGKESLCILTRFYLLVFLALQLVPIYHFRCDCSGTGVVAFCRHSFRIHQHNRVRERQGDMFCIPLQKCCPMDSERARVPARTLNTTDLTCSSFFSFSFFSLLFSRAALWAADLERQQYELRRRKNSEETSART